MATVEPRRRNAAQTRRTLLEVALRRFTRDGYAATTVRDIADDAGVNVALINRYFTSKVGLFEACLDAAVTDLSHDTEDISHDDVATRMVRRIIGSTDDPRAQDTLVMLLRSSGEDRVDELRRAVLQGISHKLAAIAGEPRDDRVVLRAQLVLATALGLSLLRSSLRLEPLASAGEQDLVGPLSEVIDTLLPVVQPIPANNG